MAADKGCAPERPNTGCLQLHAVTSRLDPSGLVSRRWREWFDLFIINREKSGPWQKPSPPYMCT